MQMMYICWDIEYNGELCLVHTYCCSFLRCCSNRRKMTCPACFRLYVCCVTCKCCCEHPVTISYGISISFARQLCEFHGVSQCTSYEDLHSAMCLIGVGRKELQKSLVFPYIEGIRTDSFRVLLTHHEFAQVIVTVAVLAHCEQLGRDDRCRKCGCYLQAPMKRFISVIHVSNVQAMRL